MTITELWCFLRPMVGPKVNSDENDPVFSSGEGSGDGKKGFGNGSGSGWGDGYMYGNSRGGCVDIKTGDGGTK